MKGSCNCGAVTIEVPDSAFPKESVLCREFSLSLAFVSRFARLTLFALHFLRLQELPRIFRISVRCLYELTKASKLQATGADSSGLVVTYSFSVNLVIPTKEITFTNESNIGLYEDKNTDSGNTAQRKFCKTCGS